MSDLKVGPTLTYDTVNGFGCAICGPKLKERCEHWLALAAQSATPSPAPSPPPDHLKHIQRFLLEMYQTMVDPVEEFDGNIEQLCALLLKRAREDRQALEDVARAVPPKAVEQPRWECTCKGRMNKYWQADNDCPIHGEKPANVPASVPALGTCDLVTRPHPQNHCGEAWVPMDASEREKWRAKVLDLKEQLSARAALLERLEGLLWECARELEYVQCVENCNSGLCATSLGKDLVRRALELLKVDFYCETYAEAKKRAALLAEGKPQ